MLKKLSIILALSSVPLFAQEHSHHECSHPLHKNLHVEQKKDDFSLSGVLTVDNFFESHGDRTTEALGRIAGFGHAHEDEHNHGSAKDGFQMRHTEIEIQADYKEAFRVLSVFGFSKDLEEVEELYLESLTLPYGFNFKIGQFFSEVGIFNKRHQHAQPFTNQNLINRALFDDHGIQERGFQLNWNPPDIEGLRFGLEILEGDSEAFAEQIKAQGLKKRSNPKLWTTFIKYQHDINEKHFFAYGLSYAQGRQQEAHDEDEDEVNDHFFDGTSYLYGADFAYYYKPQNEDGSGDIAIEMEYFRRDKELTVARHDLEPTAVGLSKTDRQDGITLQALYGITPKLRTGLRCEIVGLTNDSQEEAGDLSQKLKRSYRNSAMLDYLLNDYNLLRAQISHYDIRTENTEEDFWAFSIQWQITLGIQKSITLDKHHEE